MELIRMRTRAQGFKVRFLSQNQDNNTSELGSSPGAQDPMVAQGRRREESALGH